MHLVKRIVGLGCIRIEARPCRVAGEEAAWESRNHRPRSKIPSIARAWGERVRASSTPNEPVMNKTRGESSVEVAGGGVILPLRLLK